MKTINILPQDIISKIAAGEVIERPASIVKELLENSIDAGADRISIRIEKGGKKLIKVIDNGIGMSKEDLRLCIESHATSKISSLDDLSNIKTLGFRGEAIPSIGAVSRLRITSKPHDQLIGHKIEVEGGRFICLEETSALSGTIVEVRDVFFNLPARKKFLRSDKVETDHIIEAIIKISLCNLNTSILIEHGSKIILNIAASDEFVSRFSLLFGDELREYMEERTQVYEDMVIKAYLTLPEASRSKADRLFFYVNGRHIKSKLIAKALMNAYGERLMKGNYPQGAIFIEIDPKKVDFNVHPTKQEIRFQEESVIYKSIFSCIRNMLSSYMVGYEAPISAEEEEKYTQYSLVQPKTLDIIGQLKATYIVCENKDGLILVDQHAAHERIIYEGLKKDIENSRIVSQRLLEPYCIELRQTDVDELKKRIALLSEIGIEIEHFGGTTFLITSYPPILKNMDWDSFIHEMLKEGRSNELDNLLKTMACHSAIKAGDILSNTEMKALLEKLYETETPTNCPHGRPVLKKISFQELEKIFKRVV